MQRSERRRRLGERERQGYSKQKKQERKEGNEKLKEHTLVSEKMEEMSKTIKQETPTLWQGKNEAEEKEEIQKIKRRRLNKTKLMYKLIG